MKTSIHPPMSNISIDKLSAVRNVDALPFINTISGLVINETKDKKESGCVQTRKIGTYAISVKIYPPKEGGGYVFTNHILFLQINVKKGQIRIEYNPSKISDELYNHMNIFCLGIMGQTFFEFLAGAYITRIDLNIHIFGKTTEDFLFKFKKTKVHGMFCGQTKKIETIYAGRRVNNHFRVYDKAKQLNGPKHSGSCLRIETVVKNKISVLDLVNIDNPFKRVVLYDLMPKKLPKGIHPGHWQGFIDSARMRGSVTAAMQLQPKSVRGKFDYALSKMPVSWWDPDIFFGEKWYEALDEHHLLNFPAIKPLTLKTASGTPDESYYKAA